MALIPPFLLDSVVAIGFPTEDKKIYAATGFLFGRLEATDGDEKRYRVFLVTNKHVVAGKKRAFLRFNPEGGEAAKEYDIPLVNEVNDPLWKTHRDRDVDVAVIGVNVKRLREEGVRFSFVQSDAHVIALADASQAGVSEGNGVFVLGFPMGLIGEKRNFVIVRQGIIARMQDAIAGVSDEILIDVTIFPGNSGGPVFTRPEVVAIQGTTAFGKSSLLGVVASYVPYKDVAVSVQTGQPRVIFEENSGLASIVPVDRLLEVVEYASGVTSATPPEVDNTEPTPAKGDAPAPAA